MPSSGYYDHDRRDLLALLPPRVERVLEVGCGAGGTAERLRACGAKLLVGIELDAQAADRARSRFDRVLTGRVEEVSRLLPEAEFDLILYADVLEHLADPWTVLIDHRRLLQPGGHILVSVPNVRHWRVLYELVVCGRWRYQDEGGTLDRSHLRFFTRKDLMALVIGAGYHPVAEGHNEFGTLARLVDRLSFGLFRDFLVWQCFLLGRKAPWPADTTEQGLVQ